MWLWRGLLTLAVHSLVLPHPSFWTVNTASSIIQLLEINWSRLFSMKINCCQSICGINLHLGDVWHTGKEVWSREITGMYNLFWSWRRERSQWTEWLGLKPDAGQNYPVCFVTDLAQKPYLKTNQGFDAIYVCDCDVWCFSILWCPLYHCIIEWEAN